MVIVIAMYLGFFAGGAILGAQALGLVFGTRIGVGRHHSDSAVPGPGRLRLQHVHWVGRVVTPLYIAVFALLTVALLKNWSSFHAASAIATAHFQLTPFLMVVSVVAAYYISYGPYVADYSRYLPVETSTAQAFWYTYAGVITSAVWIMVLGAGIQTVFARDDTIAGTALVASSLGTWLEVLTLMTLVVGLANIGAFNIYGAMMSSLTIVTSIFNGLR